MFQKCGTAVVNPLSFKVSRKSVTECEIFHRSYATSTKKSTEQMLNRQHIKMRCRNLGYMLYIFVFPKPIER